MKAKIIFDRKKTVPLEEIKVGDFFMRDKSTDKVLYQRVAGGLSEGALTLGSTVVEFLDVQSGRVFRLDSNNKVIPVAVEILVKDT